MIIIFFFFGLFVGSFLNVIVDRLPRQESYIKGRSKCDFCGRNLEWFELIPLISFFLQSRKCRYCHKSLSWYYPAVELVTGLLFTFSYIMFPTSQLVLIYSLAIVSCMIVIFFTDLRYGIIPDQAVIFGSIVAFIYLILSSSNLILNNFITAVISFLFFIFLILITKGKGMGMGDAKLAILIGLFLGYPLSLISLYLAFLTGAVVSILLILLGLKKIKKDTIPFGPFLAICALFCYFFGNQIFNNLLKILNF